LGGLAWIMPASQARINIRLEESRNAVSRKTRALIAANRRGEDLQLDPALLLAIVSGA
jgi:hypothetical protein